MIFKIQIPSEPLNRFVSFFTYYEGYNPDHSIERFLPDGNTEIIIDLTDQPKYIYDNDTLKEIQACHQVWASGVRTNFISIPSTKETGMFVINFRKGMAAAFFPLPMSEMCNVVLDADLLWGRNFAFLREQILAEPIIELKFNVVEEFLYQQYGKHLNFDPCVEYAVGCILAKPENTSLQRLTEKIGYSQKHFIDLFRKQVGITPKAYLRIIRFQKAINEIEVTHKVDWTNLSFDCGFYDQAHFINEFKQFSGFSPEEYMRRKDNAYLNYIPVG